ncbi:S-layer protein SlpA [Acaryochloris thomasi RCC1774]|uniref:S-layer protein SlpA n=3 Tax=Acaryochloris TaxID=155977 RepID=A0A2W1JH91_9CYAN|nr:iron uptake porin [Acaryochloris thomasi]PZD72953.1 S-layer protein SlpA [Acaryochloris thomasi RCC1774]
MNKRPFLSGGLGLLGALALTAPAFADTSVSDLIAETESDSTGQVTSVSQLSDVQPTDWAFQALQSLVERYGCIAGYPNGTFRGNRSATRYEMAAALNACLDQISDRFASKADLDAVKALQDEFAAELATLRGRVDGLEARVDTVEAQQFSTTTKLEGSVIGTIQFGDQTDVDGGIGSSRASALAEVGLTFNTSFTGEDLLQITLLTGNGGNDFFGEFFDAGGGLAGGTVNPGAIEYRDTGPGVELDRLAYEFSPVENLSVTIGPQLYPSDFIDGNSYANDPGADFNSGFFINNALIINDAVDDPGGAGFGFNYNLGGGPLSLRAGYVAAAGGSAVEGATETEGLFGDPHQAVAEVEYATTFGASDDGNFAVRLQYAYTETFALVQNVVGVNAEATFGRFGVFGRYGISLDPQAGGADLFAVGTNNAQTWMAGVGVSDLLIPGSMLSFAAGQPFIAPGQPDQTNFEGFYRIPVNDNITITPAVMVITDPNNIDQNALIQGVLRTTFSF